MSVVINTYSAGRFTSKVFADAMVEVQKDGITFDRPGPWGDIDGAEAWAKLIVNKYDLEDKETA